MDLLSVLCNSPATENSCSYTYQLGLGYRVWGIRGFFLGGGVSVQAHPCTYIRAQTPRDLSKATEA